MIRELCGRFVSWALGEHVRNYRPSDPTWALARLTGDEDKLTDPYMQHTWVFACIKSIATNIANVPFVLQTGRDDNVRAITDGILYRRFTRPNVMWSRWHLIEATASWLEMEGNAMWVLKRENPKQVPGEIMVMGRTGFEPILGEDNTIQSWTYEKDGRKKPLEAHQVIHFRLWSPASPIWGMGPLQAARLSADSDYQAGKYNKAFFENSAIPGGIIRYPENVSLTPEQRKEMRTSWNDLHRGAKKSHKLAVLDSGAEYQTISLTHSDMQFLQQRKWSREEILACFRVPPTEVGIFDAVHKATAEDTRRGYWEQTLLPICTLIEDTLRAQFFQPFDEERTWAAFDRSAIAALNESEDKKIEKARKYWDMGVPLAVINERLGLDLPTDKIPGADVGYMSLGVVPVGVLPGEAWQEPADATGETPPAEPPPAEEPAPEKGAARAHTAALHTPEQIRDLEIFYRALDPQERRFRETVDAYLTRIKAWLREQLGKYGEVATIPADALELADKWDAELQKLAGTHYRRVAALVKPQVEARIKRAGIDFTLDLQDERLVDFVASKAIKVVEINDGIRDGIREALKEGVSENLTMSELQESIFAVMQDSRARSLRIARTETTSAANGTEFIAHNIAGIEKHVWVAALDEATRDSHIACMRQGPIAVGTDFLNGCKFPGDPEGAVGEIVNCRCTLVPTE